MNDPDRVIDLAVDYNGTAYYYDVLTSIEAGENEWDIVGVANDIVGTNR